MPTFSATTSKVRSLNPRNTSVASDVVTGPKLGLADGRLGSLKQL